MNISQELLNRQILEGKDMEISSSANKIKKKIFRDNIHKDIELHPAVVEIIDTKEFQRLRKLQQLGAASYVYAGK